MSNDKCKNDNDLKKIVDPAIALVKKALGEVRFKYVQEQLDEILRESVSEYAKKWKMEWLLQSLTLGVASHGDSLVSVGPCTVPENKDFRMSKRPVTFSQHMWSARALAYVSTRDFYDKVLKMDQSVLEHTNLSKPLPDATGAVSEAQLAKIGAITTLMENLMEDHYALVFQAFQLYEYFDDLYLAYKAKQFLFFMSQVRAAVFHYNAHNAGSHPHLEQSALYEMRKLSAIAQAALRYVRDKEFLSIMLGGEKAAPATASKKAKDEALANLWDVIPEEQAPVAAQIARVRLHRNAGGVPVQAVFRIRAEEVVVNMDRSRPLPDVISDIANNVQRVIDHTLAECAEVIRVAQLANYNLATGQWGSFFALSDNERHMRSLEPLIFHEAGAVGLDLLPPRFYLLTHFTTLFIPTRLSFTTVAHTEGVKPGQTIKYRVTTGTTTKETTAKTQSIAETQTQEAQDDFSNELATTMAEKNTRSTDNQRYSDSANSIAQNKAWDFGASLDVSVGKSGVGSALGYSVDASVAYNCSENTDTSAEASQSLSEQVQTEQEVSNEVQKKALAKHMTKKAATRQTNVAVSTEVSSEQTKTESRDEEFTNPSTIAPMTVFFLKLVQEYVAIRAVTGFSIMFINGVDFKVYEITEFNTVMQEYLETDLPDVQREIDAFRNLIRVAGVRRDYRRRQVSLLSETPAGNFEFRADLYHLLVDGGLDEQDIDLVPVKDRVFGCVTGVEPCKMPSAGYFTVCIMGPPVLDDNAQRMYEASLLARDLENQYKDATIRQLDSTTGIQQEIKAWILGIKEVNEVTKFQREAMFELLKENKAIYDNYEMRRLFTDWKKGDDTKKLFEGAK